MHGEVALEAVQFRVVPVEVVPLAPSAVGVLGADEQPGGVEPPLPLPHEGRSTIPLISSHSISNVDKPRFRVALRPLSVKPITANPETGIQITPYSTFATEDRSLGDNALRSPEDAVRTSIGEGPVVVKVRVAVAGAPFVMVNGLVPPNEHVGAVVPLTVGEMLHVNVTVPE